MLWKTIHDTLKWIGITFFPAITALALASAGIAQGFPASAPWFVARWYWLSSMMGQWYFWVVAALAFVAWLGGLVYSAHKVAAAAGLPNAPGTGIVDRDLVRESRSARTDEIVKRFTIVPKRDKTLHDGLIYAASGVWRVETGPSIPHEFKEYGEALSRFLQIAHDGDVTVWGKRARFQASGVYEIIPKAEWAEGYVDLPDCWRAEDSRMKRRDNNQTMHVDLWICRAEFEQAWPVAAKPEADTAVAEAIVYLELGSWKGYIDDLYDREPQKRKLAYKRFERLAQNGKLTVWGKWGGKGKERPMPKSVWETFEIDEDAMEDNDARAVPRPGKTTNLTFSDLMVSGAQIEQLRIKENGP